MDGKELMIKLCDSFAISGSEHRLHGILEEAFKEYTDEISYGVLSDFIGIKKGSASASGNGAFKIMIAAHADEVGLIVKNINDRGFIEFANVCGVDPKTLPAQEVIVYGKREVYGVIGAKPPHVLTEEDMKKAIKLEDMVIDVGMSKEEVLEVINVGDFITIKRQCASLLNDYITGKALDDRCGIAAMYECAKELSRLKHSADVYFVATSQEERGHHGATTMTYAINPDIGIAVDVDFGDKYAYPDAISECGKGVEITVGPNMHHELNERLMKVADDYNIKYEIDVAGGIPGTDGAGIQIAREGVPTLLVSIPLRYMHTSTEVVCYKDVVEAGKLLALFIASITDWSEIYA
jgi:tetrahedral aminopeptidase